MSLQRIKIKRIVQADFRKGPHTLYDELKRNRKLWAGDIGTNECYLFVSHTGNKVAFVLGRHQMQVRNRSGEFTRTLLDCRVWRIDGGQFNPSMLEDYANRVGLTLGRKTFAQAWGERCA